MMAPAASAFDEGAQPDASAGKPAAPGTMTLRADEGGRATGDSFTGSHHRSELGRSAWALRPPYSPCSPTLMLHGSRPGPLTT